MPYVATANAWTTLTQLTREALKAVNPLLDTALSEKWDLDAT
eukprot:CAMPEP_0184397194 /NCGR_PEP_ID=MMETSP0007-20130409/58537_1 /TAXON_ID=97485 /ORGANISM="Prymnesium parvum, Strain Texoma1" /LENGTH=41 /DNA_ID= /DNA_START= /DNA_END= /DNA_ORIENTATION=